MCLSAVECLSAGTSKSGPEMQGWLTNQPLSQTFVSSAAV